eukprot:403364896
MITQAGSDCIMRGRAMNMGLWLYQTQMMKIQAINKINLTRKYLHTTLKIIKKDTIIITKNTMMLNYQTMMMVAIIKMTNKTEESLILTRMKSNSTMNDYDDYGDEDDCKDELNDENKLNQNDQELEESPMKYIKLNDNSR